MGVRQNRARAVRRDRAGRRGASSPGRAPPGPRCRRPCRAGSGGPARWGVSLPHSESQGLSRAPAASSGVFLRRGGRANAALRPSGRPGADASAGTRRPRAARGQRGAAWSSSRRPLSCLQTASEERQASILSLSPALTPSFFSCLTNPRIIQLRKRWKEVSEGGGRRVEIFGSSAPGERGAEEVGGWVEECGGGARCAPRGPPAGDRRAAPRAAPLPEEDPPPGRPLRAADGALRGRRRSAGIPDGGG